MPFCILSHGGTLIEDTLFFIEIFSIHFAHYFIQVVSFTISTIESMTFTHRFMVPIIVSVIDLIL